MKNIESRPGDGSHNAAKLYVQKGLYEKGGLEQGLRGFWLKTLPIMLGSLGGLTFSRVAALFLRFLHYIAVALFPIFARKVVVSPSTVGASGGGIEKLIKAALELDATDYLLAGIAITLAVFPKILDFLGREKSGGEPHDPYYDLAAAIKLFPLCSCKVSLPIDDSLRLALLALRGKLSQLVGDAPGARLTDITLLEFCDDQGVNMQVRVRTANHEPTQRPVAAEKFLAYFVAKEGRWFVEHDFTSKRHPFPPVRLTVVGSPKVNYRSVLYLPLMVAKQAVSEELPNGQHGAPKPYVIDYCLGVICVHCAGPYRFWRWGDQNKLSGGFGNVAYERSMPYIALITKLLEPTAKMVRLESP